MEKQSKRLIFSWTPLILLLAFPILYAAVDFLLDGGAPVFRWKAYLSSPETGSHGGDAVEEDIGFLLRRFFSGDDLRDFDRRGFACDRAVHSVVCVSKIPVTIDTRKNTTVLIKSVDFSGTPTVTVVRPYAKQEEPLNDITPVRILHTTDPPPCDFHHRVPAVIFSSGSTGNVFHEMNEIIIPLYITTHYLKSKVQLILEDYKPSFTAKYVEIISQLSDRKILNPSEKMGVHCFPAAIVGLKYHDNLAINPNETPTGSSMTDFRRLLRRAYKLEFSHVSQIQKPRLLLLSRTNTRRFLNEESLISTIKQIGFDLVVVKRSKTMSNLTQFARLINSCKVLVGPHGAGLTNEIFLPDGAVMVQVELLGMEWGSNTYYGDTAKAMNVRYLRYKIEAEESSLLKLYGRNHSVISDPGSVYRMGGYRAARSVFLDLQNVRINVTRFRDTLVEAFSLVSEYIEE